MQGFFFSLCQPGAGERFRFALLIPAYSTPLRCVIWLALLVNAASMLTPIINEGDSVTYAALSQHITQSGHWGWLVLDGQDWLDKPHFPFWVTALFFQLGGVSAFTYILPGFLFHLLGGYYTYRMARWLCRHDAAQARAAASLALLVYVSAFHLMYTSSAIKAEAFLTGSIMAASYYWLRFDAQARLKYLVLGAVFSAMAVMTKGIFTLITMGSGLVCMWLYQKQWGKLVSGKWWLAIGLTLLFTAPELLALYWQFDAHPEKVVLGQTGVSGIRFFLWDSQFGRFFNSGPIKNEAGNPLFFAHVFLWAFLPWVAVFVWALASGLRRWRSVVSPERSAFVYLCAAFFTTFVLFSATSFQLDYYTVILFPFAAVLSGHCLAATDFSSSTKVIHGRVLVWAQSATVLLVVALSMGLALYVGRIGLLLLVAGGVVLLLAGLYLWRRQWRFYAVFLAPVLSILTLYAFLEAMTWMVFTQYSTPYQLKPYLAATGDTPIYTYQMDPIIRWELGVYLDAQGAYPRTFGANEPAHLPPKGSSFVLVARMADIETLAPALGATQVIAQGNWVDHKTGTLPKLLRLAKGVEPLERIAAVWVRGQD